MAAELASPIDHPQLPILSGPDAGSSALGPVAGIVAKVVLEAATGGIASLAGAVDTCSAVPNQLWTLP